MKLKKLLVLGLALACIATISITATLAYFTDTDEVTNTFTVGHVDITLDEAPVDEEGQEKDGDRVQKNEYKLYPGKTYDKDPMVTVVEGSEDCWVFVKYYNGISAIEDTTNTVAAQMTANGWTLVEGTTDIYAYEEILSAKETAVVFENFTIAGTVTSDDLAKYATEEYAEANIKLVAYAVQAEGFSTAKAAWDAAYENGEVGQ